MRIYANVLYLFLAVVAGGCVTVASLEKMTPTERADYVCSRDRDFKSLQASENAYQAKINDIRDALSRGYRVHRSCQDVRIEVPGDLHCTTQGYGPTKYTDCTQSKTYRNEQRCTETPVAINPGLERSNLQQFESGLLSTSKQKSETYRSCHGYVSTLSAEQAYRYYNK